MMNYPTILKKSESVFLWIFNNITNKFKNVFNKLRDRFPIINRYPLLKYSLIPLLLTLFILLRYIIKFGINEIATIASGFVGEISGYSISERTVVLFIAAVLIIMRIVVLVYKQKNQPKSELNYENAK